MTLPPRFERVVTALGALARPFVLFSAGGSSALATVSIVWMRLDLMAGAAFITAAWAGTGVLYGAKALEERSKAKADAQARVAEAAITPMSEPTDP